jgi:hypothetical protein
MIKNPAKLREFEDQFIRDSDPLSYPQALRQFTALWQEAVALGVLPPQDPLEGIEVDLRIARILNACLKNSSSG